MDISAATEAGFYLCYYLLAIIVGILLEAYYMYFHITEQVFSLYSMMYGIFGLMGKVGKSKTLLKCICSLGLN